MKRRRRMARRHRYNEMSLGLQMPNPAVQQVALHRRRFEAVNGAQHFTTLRARKTLAQMYWGRTKQQAPFGFLGTHVSIRGIRWRARRVLTRCLRKMDGCNPEWVVDPDPIGPLESAHSNRRAQFVLIGTSHC